MTDTVNNQEVDIDQEVMSVLPNMDNVIAVKKALEDKFVYLADKISIPKYNRVFIEPVGQPEFDEIFAYAIDELGFVTFLVVIGLDSGDNLEFIYSITDANNTMLNIKLYAPKTNPVIKSVSDRFCGAVFHERELVDLLGTVVDGLPPGDRYPLPDGWPEGEYPLRKDWDPRKWNPDTMTYNREANSAEQE